MDEIERKVDMLISGIVLPQKRTRRRVATIVTIVLIAMTLIASASVFTYYYQQTADVSVESAIIITDPAGGTHVPPWDDPVTIGTIYAGDTYIYPPDPQHYTITLNANAQNSVKIYIHTTVTETLSGGGTGDGEGLTVEVHNGDPPGAITQIDLAPGGSVDFTIHITADELIDHTSTYGYAITMDLEQP